MNHILFGEKIKFLSIFDTEISLARRSDLFKMQEMASQIRTLAKDYQNLKDGVEELGLVERCVRWSKAKTLDLAMEAVYDETGFHPAEAKKHRKLKARYVESMFLLAGLCNEYMHRYIPPSYIAPAVGKDRTVVIYYTDKHKGMMDSNSFMDYIGAFKRIENNFIEKVRSYLSQREKK